MSSKNPYNQRYSEMLYVSTSGRIERHNIRDNQPWSAKFKNLNEIHDQIYQEKAKTPSNIILFKENYKLNHFGNFGFW